MSLIILQYQNMQELQHAHPDIKNFTVVHQASSRETGEEQLTALRNKHIEGRVYQVGNYFWKAAQYSRQGTITTP